MVCICLLHRKDIINYVQLALHSYIPPQLTPSPKLKLPGYPH